MKKDELIKLAAQAALDLQRPHGWLCSAEQIARERSLNCPAQEERDALDDAKTAYQLGKLNVLKRRPRKNTLRVVSGCCFAGVGQACPVHEKR